MKIFFPIQVSSYQITLYCVRLTWNYPVPLASGLTTGPSCQPAQVDSHQVIWFLLYRDSTLGSFSTTLMGRPTKHCLWNCGFLQEPQSTMPFPPDQVSNVWRESFLHSWSLCPFMWAQWPGLILGLVDLENQVAKLPAQNLLDFYSF